MSDIQQSHQLHGGSDSDGVRHRHRPYWTRAHRDWRVWVIMLVMLACMIAYVMSQNLSLQPRNSPQPPVPESLGR